MTGRPPLSRNGPRVSINIYMTEAQKAKLIEIARRTGTSPSGAVRDWLDRMLHEDILKEFMRHG